MNPFYVGLDDSKRTLVVAILRPGEREPEQREMPKEPHLIQRLFRRLMREDAVARLRGVAGRDHRQHLTIMPRETRGEIRGRPVERRAAGAFMILIGDERERS